MGILNILSGGLNFYVTPSGNQTEWNDDNIGSGIDVCGNFTNGVSDTPKLALAMGRDQRLYMPGFVGINVTDPTCNLDIDGSMNMTGAANIGGAIIAGSETNKDILFLVQYYPYND